MPSFSEQQTSAATLIQSQIESLENAAETLPYWEVYHAIAQSSASNNTPVTLTKDRRILTEGTVVVPDGYAYLYLKVIAGPVVIDDLPFETNEFLNLEPVSGARHPSTTIEIPASCLVRLVGGF